MTLAELVEDRRTDFYEESTALFSPCRTYRYALTRRWNPDMPLAVFVMLNPSTADAFVMDPTVRRCVGFARSWLAGGVLILNLFALRSTDPTALVGHADPVGPDNDQVVAHHFSVDYEPVGPVVCAWGAHGAVNDRADRVEKLLRARGARPVCLGTTKDGHPRHPLYVPAATATVDYRGGEQQ